MPAIAAMISFYRALGRAPTGGDSNRLHNRLIRLGESPVGAGHARDCGNDQRRAIKVSGLFLSSIC